MTRETLSSTAVGLLMLLAFAAGTPALCAAGPEDLHDITGIEPAPPAPPGWHWSGRKTAAIGLGILLLGSLAGLGWTVLRRNGRRSPPLPPERWALGELDRIDGLALPAAGAFESYHTLLSDVVRRYLELRYGFPASEQTSAEILHTLTASDAVAEPQRALLRDLLARCDLAKFAGLGGSADECRATTDGARVFIAETSAPATRTSVPSGETAQR
jgi:hypothetical protein